MFRRRIETNNVQGYIYNKVALGTSGFDTGKKSTRPTQPPSILTSSSSPPSGHTQVLSRSYTGAARRLHQRLSLY